MATSAQDEFDELMRDKGSRRNHPEDDITDSTSVRHAMSTADVQMPRSSMSSARDRIPHLRYGANTGPKGVITDAQDFEQQKLVNRLAVQTSRASLAADRQGEKQEPTFGQQEQAERAKTAQEHGNDLDEEDDVFVAQWREERMKELVNGAHLKSASNETGLQSVDPQGYLDAVEQSGPNTVVVVYIYDDRSEVSKDIEDALRTLSYKHTGVRFVKLHHEDAEMSYAGVPGIIAYRGGEQFALLVPFLEEMPDDGDFEAEVIEKVLQRHQILT